MSESRTVIPMGDLSGAMCSSLDSRLKVELLGFANVTATVKLGALWGGQVGLQGLWPPCKYLRVLQGEANK